jgi:VWA domain-containing protein
VEATVSQLCSHCRSGRHPLARRSLLSAIIVHGALLALGAPAAVADDSRAGQTQVYGVIGRGSRFVYVFDRSLSMRGAALASAKRELLASLGQLQRVHQFQIIFYNEKPRMMQPPQMVFADENGLRQADSFVTSIAAAGGTDHLQALQLALRMAPDVIFLLTDADEPPLTPRQLDEIRSKNAATSINVIEFKSGPEQRKGGFLRQLAEDNRGQYKHIDTTTLEPAR